MKNGQSLESPYKMVYKRISRGFGSKLGHLHERSREEPDQVCAADGQVIGDEQDILERWREYFVGLLQGGTQVAYEVSGDDAGVFCQKSKALVARKLSGYTLS